MYNQKIIFILMMSFGLSACGARQFSTRSTNPLIEDNVKIGWKNNSKMAVLTSRADRRTILIFERGKVCAEPPPDVAEAVFHETAAKLAAKGFEGGIDSKLQTALMQMTRRSQGLDLYRNGSFVNCMIHYSGAMSNEQYIEANRILIEKSVELIKLEMDKLPAISATGLQVSPSTSVKGLSDKQEKPNEADTEDVKP